MTVKILIRVGELKSLEEERMHTEDSIRDYSPPTASLSNQNNEKRFVVHP